jgi:hypothetical protein
VHTIQESRCRLTIHVGNNLVWNEIICATAEDQILVQWQIPYSYVTNVDVSLEITSNIDTYLST